MKQLFWKLIVLLVVATVSVNTVSCGGDDDDDTPKKENGNQGSDSSNSTGDMTPTEQKQYLDKVGKEFMNITAASDFKGYADFGKFINNTYVKNYDFDIVEKWAKDCFDALLEKTGHSEESNPYIYETWGYVYNYIYDDYEALILASNFYSHFTASNGRWVRSDANDLQFIFKGQNGENCVLKLQTSGKVVKVHAGILNNSDSSYDYIYENNKYINIYNYNYNRYDCTVGLPEQITVSLTQGQTTLVKSTVKIDIASISGEEFDISRDKLNVTAEVELSNGYKINVVQAAYSGNQNAAANCVVSKNGTTLVSMKVDGNVSGVPSETVSTITERQIDLHNADLKNGVATVDILGKIQVKGTISDVKQFADYLQAADNNNRNESQFKSYVNQANSLVDLNIYYDGKDKKQASVKLEVFSKQDWRGTMTWKAEPVLVFFDGSSYSTLSAFFNENDFRSLIDAFKSLANQYADLIDKKVKW